MKTLKKTLMSEKPTLAVFMRIGGQNASVVKLTMDELREKYADRLEFIMVDASFDSAVVEKYKLTHYPTWRLFKGQQEVWRAEGNRTVDDIAKAIESN